MGISMDVILLDYKNIKKRALSLFNHRQYEKCLTVIEYACKIAYNFNFHYLDVELEALTVKISKELLPNVFREKIKDKYVFYDCFAYDNRGLTQQYIRALKEWNVPFLFILSSGKIEMSTQILEELESIPNASVFIVSESLSRLDKIRQISQVITDYKPSKAFLHMSPWDAVGTVVWNACKEITKYQINLTDHAFWLGQSCTDYCLEFRNYGYSISLKHRGFRTEQLLLQPYYPITSENIPFQGFPTDVKGKTVIFTGGTYYKMYGEGGKFFYLIKRILDRHKDCVLFIAGGGDAKPLIKFIEENDFQNRVYLLGNRKDISSVFENTDIYLATYPLGGGLMTQMATAQCKNCIAFTSPDLQCNFIEELVKTNEKITFTDEVAFLEEIAQLINDKHYRQQKANRIKPIITAEEFNTSLRELIFLNENYKLIPAYYDVDIKRFSELYLECENKYLKTYNSIIFQFARETNFRVPFRMLVRCARYVKSKYFK